MNLVNNNLSPLPFYDNIAFQNHRKDYAFGQVYPLITYKSNLLPFQVVIPTGSSITAVHLQYFNSSRSRIITSSIVSSGLAIKSFDDFKLLVYPGTTALNIDIPEGQYYLIIYIADFGILYSDVFNVCNDVSDYLLLEYSNSDNLEIKNGIVDFSNDFKFKCYLNTQIGKPSYTFEEETTSRLGYTFIESQVSKKVYNFTFLAPEYLCDALRIVRLCENKQITSKSQVYDLIGFNIEPEWEDQGDLAAVKCEFETDTVIARTGGFTRIS